MLNGEKRKWVNWLKHRDAAEKATRVGVSESKQHYEKALYRLHHVTKPWEPKGVSISEPPTAEDVEQVLNVLKKTVNGATSKWEHLSTYKEAIAKIEDAWNQATAAKRDLEQKQEAETEALGEMEKVRQAMPTASDAAVEAIQKEIDQRKARVTRIDDTLAAMKDSASIVSEIEEQADAAKAEVDRLEAEALLETVDQKERQAAATTLAKARKALEKAASEAEKQSAARRGLESMRHDLRAEIEDLEGITKLVAFEVAKVKVAEHETALVNAIERLNIPQIMQNLNTARADASRNAPEGQSYNTGRIKITFPTMYAIEEPEEIETSGLELSE